MRRTTIALMLALAACASEEQGADAEIGDARTTVGSVVAADPGARFDTLERDLLAAEVLRCSFSIRAEGAVAAELAGELVLGPGERVHLSASGNFAGREQRLAILAGGDGVINLAVGDRYAVVTDAPRIREALALGLTRMGLLHNLARLTALQPPDGSSGNFRGSACCLCFEEGPEGAIDFQVFWKGEHAAAASLALDELGLPRQRRQTVHFDAGDMRVVESYEAFLVAWPVQED